MGHWVFIAGLFTAWTLVLYGAHIENAKKGQERIYIAEQKDKCIQACAEEADRLCELICVVNANAALAGVRGK